NCYILLRRDFSRRLDSSDCFAIEKNIHGRVGLGGRVEDAAVPNEKHAKCPFDRWSADFSQAGLPPSDECHPRPCRRSAGKAAPFERQRRWSLARARKTAARLQLPA